MAQFSMKIMMKVGCLINSQPPRKENDDVE